MAECNHRAVPGHRHVPERLRGRREAQVDTAAQRKSPAIRITINAITSNACYTIVGDRNDLLADAEHVL